MDRGEERSLGQRAGCQTVRRWRYGRAMGARSPGRPGRFPSSHGLTGANGLAPGFALFLTIRDFIELVLQLRQARFVLRVAGTGRVALLELHLLGGHFAKIGDGESLAENLVAADLELGAAFGGQIVAD